MIYTGVDGDKTFSISFSVLKKEWKPVEGVGKKIYAVSSDRSLVRIEKTDIRDPYDLRRYLTMEVEERFGEVLWDVKLIDDTYCLSIVKDFIPPDDMFSMEPEVFSLARVCRALSLEDCSVLDIGRRKTTLVKVREGKLISYRVVLKGGDYIDEHISKALGLSPEEARRIKFSEGLKNEGVREAMGRIISSLGVELEGETVLLSGGGSRLRGIEELFDRVVRNSYVEPELSTAFGASLKFVFRDCSPDFREEELSEKQLRNALLIMGSSILLFLGSLSSLSTIEKGVVGELRRAEREAFKKEFPTLPAVAVRDQVKSMLQGESYGLTKRLLSLADKLREGVEIYRIEFKDGKLRVFGVARDEKVARELGAESMKKTPEGGFEFEVEL